MPTLAKWVNGDLSKGFTVSQVARKHDWPESMVWSQALKGKDDLTRFKELNWGVRTWDIWNYIDCDTRFGDEWPGRIPAQLVAHILYYFSKQNDLIFDPMAGGGVCADTCLAMGRRCWSLDMEDRPDTRPEIEPYYWDLEADWEDLPIIKSKDKPDLIIWDPPYFNKKAGEYSKESISGFSRINYLEFMEKFFSFLRKISKKSTTIAFINADWRDFQNCPADEEDVKKAILTTNYYDIFNKTGWTLNNTIQAAMSSERFHPGVVSAMQKKKILGITSRYVMILK